MPLHDLLEYSLPIALNHISMARNDLVKVPLRNASHAFVERCPIARTGAVPNHALLPNRTSPRVLQCIEDLGQDAASRVEVGLTELLVRWQVEEEIALDEGARGLVVEDELFVDVRVDVFNVELGVEGRVDGDGRRGVFLEQVPVRRGDLEVALFVAILRECFGAENFGFWVGL